MGMRIMRIMGMRINSIRNEGEEKPRGDKLYKGTEKKEEISKSVYVYAFRGKKVRKEG